MSSSSWLDFDLTELVQRCRDGDPDAGAMLFTRYAVRLSRLAQQHLSRRLAGRLDGSDVVQSVFRSFFARAERGEFRIDDSAQLWRLLVTITLRKTRRSGRHHTAERRDAAREQSPADDEGFLIAIAAEPGPDAAVALADQVEALLQGLTPWHAQVLELRLAGHSPTEIAGQHGKSRQAVYRALADLQERLARLQ